MSLYRRSKVAKPPKKERPVKLPLHSFQKGDSVQFSRLYGKQLVSMTGVVSGNIAPSTKRIQVECLIKGTRYWLMVRYQDLTKVRANEQANL